MQNRKHFFQVSRTKCLTSLAAVGLLVGLASPARADLETVAKSLPQDAIGAVSIDLQPGTWDFFLKQPTIRNWLMSDDIAKMNEDLKKDAGVELKDLLPALGTHGMLALYQAPKGQSDPDGAFSLELKSMDPFKKAFDKLKAKKENPDFLIETYKGTEIYTSVKKEGEDSGEFVAMCLSGNKFLFSSKLDRLKKMLDAGATGQGLMANPSFKPVYQALGKEPVMVWVDLKAAKSAMAEGMKSMAEDLGPLAMFEQGMAYNDSLGIGFRLDQQGLMIKNLLGFSKNGLTGSQQAYLVKLTSNRGASAESLLAMMPEQPLLASVSNSLTVAFENPVFSGGISKPDDNQDTVKMMLDILNEAKKTTGLDLAQDILARSDGRIGMTSFYLDHYPSYDQIPHFVAMLGVKDGPAFMANLQQKLKLHLEALDKGEVDPKATPVVIGKQAVETYKGVSIYQFEGNPELTKMNQEISKELKTELAPSFALINQVFVFGDSPEAVRATIDYSQQTRKSLLADSEFKRIRGRMNGKDETGLFYGDLTRWYRLADNYLHGESWFKAMKPLFGSMKAMAGDSSVDPNASQGHFLIDADLKQVDFEKMAADFSAIDTQEKLAQVEENMASAQRMIQAYDAHFKGQLPRNSAQLMGVDRSKHALGELSSNPFLDGTGVQSKPGDAGNIMDFYTWKSFKPSPELGGLVLIDNIYGKKVLIYGTDQKGELIKHDGKVFFLEVLPK